MTETEGRESLFEAKGTFFKTDEEFTASYREEDDFITLRATPRGFDMERKPRLFMRFLPDRETAAELTFGRGVGKFSVFTTFYSFHFYDSEQNPTVKLEYELRFPDDIQKFSLKIFIQIISEDS